MINKSDSKKCDTMALWNQVCETNPAITKRVNQRGGFTAIDAQSQIKRATELWGPFGSKWGFKDFRFDYIYGEDTNKVTGIALTGKFYYPDGQFPIASDMPYRPNDDCFKKLQTDCITKALSRLGFNSDVFEGKFDDNRYIESLKKKYNTENQAIGEAPPPRPEDVMDAIYERYVEMADGKYAVKKDLLKKKILEVFGKLPTRMESINKVLRKIVLDDIIEMANSDSTDIESDESDAETVNGIDD